MIISYGCYITVVTLVLTVIVDFLCDDRFLNTLLGNINLSIFVRIVLFSVTRSIGFR